MTQSHPRPFSSVPLLQEASQVSLAIVVASQKIRRNKAAFHPVANDAYEFVDDMIHCYQFMEPYFPLGVPEDLTVVFQRTVNALKFLRNFMREVGSRNFFTALILSRSDAKDIQTHELTLAMNKDLFKILSNIYLRRIATSLSAETQEAWRQISEAAPSV